MALRRALIETRHGYMHVKTAGSGGTPLVLLSPGLSAGRVYEPLVDYFSDRLVVIPDRLGFGHSDRVSGPLPFTELAAATLDVLDALEIDTFDAFGVHTGSIESIELATSYPERVRRLSVVEVPAFSVEDVDEFKSHYVQHPSPTEDGSHLEWYWNWWSIGDYDGGAPRVNTYPPALTQRWVEEHLAALPDFWWAYHAAIEHPTRDLVKTVTQPMLVFSTHDDLAEQTLRAIPTLPENTTVVDLPEFADILKLFAWLPADAEVIVSHLRPFLDAP
jgi:pimeloyl-ACP methyl ester carboxylesterase